MSLKLKSAFVLLVNVFAAFCCFKTTADKAIPLITVNDNPGEGEDQFVLNPDAISLIKDLSSPLKVISAIGDARVGKSTALNFIHHTLTNSGTYEEVFETGSSMEAVTRGVWISIIQIHGKYGMDSAILLDVEGTDLGDDTVTDKLGVFAALMSSSLLLFTKECPTNHITDFLYKISRIRDMAFDKEDRKYPPDLITVLRGSLDPPKGYTSIDDYVKDSLIKPTWDESLKSQEKKRVIKSHFSKEKITVMNLPFISNRNILKKVFHSDDSSRNEYLIDINSLKTKLMNLPAKRISEEGSHTSTWKKITASCARIFALGQTDGAVLTDGQTLAKLAESVVKVLNNEYRSNQWINHNLYHLFENEICTKSFKKSIKPLLDAKKIKTSMNYKGPAESKISQLKERCVLKEWKDLEDILDVLDSENGWIIWYILTVCWGNLWIILLTLLLSMVAIQFRLSDIELKENVTLVDNSEYSTIGLRGVEWVWNKEAERLGLSGRGSGVVAQDVELLYPWAVTEGLDGYKRVNYFALKLMIMANKFKARAFQMIDYS